MSAPDYLTFPADTLLDAFAAGWFDALDGEER